MEFIKLYDKSQNCYNIVFKQDDKKLTIIFAGNLDLYMGISNDTIIENENISLSFNITKEDYEVYSIFDTMYEEIINGHPYGNEINFKESFEYKNLVDEQGNITWISDEGIGPAEDRMVTSKLNDDEYSLTFIRNELETDYYKTLDGICVRFRNSGSRYNTFNVPFMKMFQRLQKIDDNYHQMHI